MSRKVIPGDVVHELFCIPVSSSVMDSPRVYSEGTDVTSGVSVTNASEIAGDSVTHAIWKVDYTVPDDAEDRQVYSLIVDWKDPSGDLQCPFMFDAQASLDVDVS